MPTVTTILTYNMLIRKILLSVYACWKIADSVKKAGKRAWFLIMLMNQSTFWKSFFHYYSPLKKNSLTSEKIFLRQINDT